MTASSRRKSLEVAGLVHPNPDAVTAVLFDRAHSFFLAEDKVQVKYEMLRAHVVDGVSVTASAAEHGYSRAAFYLVSTAFSETGMAGLLDERRGRRGPVKVSPEIVELITTADPERSASDLVGDIAERFGVSLHKRTVERARWQ